MTKRVIRILLLLVLIGIASMFLYADVLIRESIKHSLAKLGVVEQLEVGYPHFGSISVPRLVVTLPFRGLLHRIDAANVSIEYSLRDLVVDKVTIRSLAIDVIGKAEPKPPENKVEPRGTFPLEAVSIEKLKLSDAREAQTKLLLEGEGRAELTGSDTTIWSTLSLSLELLSTYGVLTKETLPAADMLTLTARIELKESDLRLFLEEAKTNTLRIERDGLKSSIDRLSVNKADLYYPPFSKSSGLETELDEWTLVVQKNRVIVPNAALSVRLGEGGKQTLKANLNASHVTLNEIPLQGLSVTATVPLTAELKPNGAVVLALAIERVQLGFPLSELKASASLTRSKINKIEELSFKAFGAKVRLVEFKKNAKAGCDEARFKIEQLDIEQVATLYGKDKIKATGIADGTLPVLLCADGVHVQDGTLSVRDSGVIQYVGSAFPSSLSSSQLELVRDVLRNFKYSRFDVGVQYEPGGELELMFQLEGRNPDVQNSRPVNLNLKIEENILALVRSLRMVKEVEKEMERAIREK